MKKHKKIIVTSAIVFACATSFAALPKFTILPAEGSITAILLPSNFTVNVNYVVTNNTRIMRKLTMVAIPGVSQTTIGSGVCGNTFILSPQESCTLELVIQGNQVPTSGIMGGPKICKTKAPNDDSPDPFLCSQPNKANELAISITSSGQHAYIANQLGNSVSFCQINPATGLLNQCAVTATGLTAVEGVGFNPTKTLFFSANLGSSTISVCNVDTATGALSSCVDAGGSGFSQPDAVAFSPDGTTFYTSNVGGSVSACKVDAYGKLSACVNNVSPTFLAPSDMVLNDSGTLAYVSNRLGSTVSVCNVSGLTVNSCNSLSGSLFNQPEGITLDPSGRHAYIANAGDGKVIVCDVRKDGSGLLDNCAATDGQFRGTGNVAFNGRGTLAYVPNQLINMVFACQVSPIDGSLSRCLPSGTGLNGPSGVVIN